ncbi:SDR family oxidoreductase [Petrachloros mirabilis]
MKDITLITCATGAVGRRVVSILEAKGQRVRAGVHRIERAPKVQAQSTEVVAFDFSDPYSIEAAVTGVEQVCLITPHTNRQFEWASMLIDKAKKAGVKRIVRLSGLAAAMGPEVRVGRWMKMVENYLADSGLEWTVIRPGPFMQNFLSLYPRQGGQYWPPIGDGKICHIDVGDVADILAKVLAEEGHNRKTYTITGSQALSMTEATDLLTQAGHSNAAYDPIPEQQARELLGKAGKPEWLIDVLMQLFAAFESGAASLSVDTVEKMLGRAPVSFEQFAATQSYSGN